MVRHENTIATARLDDPPRIGRSGSGLQMKAVP
jgi:hypothetical protein